jgi:hypothetical protein
MPLPLHQTNKKENDMNANPYAKSNGEIELTLVNGNCRVTGKPPIENAGSAGPPWAVYKKSDGSLAQFSGTGARRGNPGGERGPRTGLIPLALVAAGLAMEEPVRIKDNDSDKVKEEKRRKNAGYTIALELANLEAVIPATGGEKKTLTNSEIAKAWKEHARKNKLDAADMELAMEFAEKNRVVQIGGTPERAGTVLELAEKYPGEAMALSFKAVRDYQDQRDAALRDAFRLAQLPDAAA